MNIDYLLDIQRIPGSGFKRIYASKTPSSKTPSASTGTSFSKTLLNQLLFNQLDNESSNHQQPI